MWAPAWSGSYLQTMMIHNLRRKRVELAVVIWLQFFWNDANYDNQPSLNWACNVNVISTSFVTHFSGSWVLREESRSRVTFRPVNIFKNVYTHTSYIWPVIHITFVMQHKYISIVYPSVRFYSLIETRDIVL